jgi:zinc protease
MQLPILIAATCLAAQPPAPAPRPEHGDALHRYTLDNGLRVRLLPSATGTMVALVVLFELGEENNPPGKSGLAHLIEHLYVTCAAGDAPARTAQGMMAAYPPPGGSNAQTGIDYTVMSAVFAANRLEAEIADAAARMGDLRIEQQDLDRELPRVDAELANMYGEFPHLAAPNLAREAVDPRNPGARRGGVIEQLRTATVEEAWAWHARYYKPGNAILVIAGRFDPAEARRLIEKAFRGMLSGEPPPAPVPALPAREGGTTTVDLQRPEFGQWPAAMAAVAYRVPDPAHEDYVPFLMLLGRHQMKAMPEMQRQLQRQQQGHMALSPVQYAPLDAPRVAYLCANVQAGEQVDAEAIITEIRGRVPSLMAERATPQEWRQPVTNLYGMMLRLGPGAETMAAMNPYLAAFSLGRMEQMGLDPAVLRQAIEAVTMQDLKRCAEAVFGDGRGAGVLVRID